MKRLHFNGLYDRNDIQWELGMGVPCLAMYYCGLFKDVVATDVSMAIYSSVVHQFEILAYEQSLLAGYTGRTKTHKLHPHAKYDFELESGNNTGVPRRCRRKVQTKRARIKDATVISSGDEDEDDEIEDYDDDGASDDYEPSTAESSSSSDDD